jgi:hypothetical protein
MDKLLSLHCVDVNAGRFLAAGTIENVEKTRPLR